MLDRENLYHSVSSLHFCPLTGWDRPLPYREGLVDIPDNKIPPSRAYRKTEEV